MSPRSWTAILAATLSMAAPLLSDDFSAIGIADSVESPLASAFAERETLRQCEPSKEMAARQIAVAETFLSFGSNDLAVAEFTSYRSIYGNKYGMEAEALNGEASALLQQGQYEKAASRFLEASRASSNAVFSARCLMNNAKALKLCKLYAAAAMAFDAAAISAEAASLTNEAWRARWEFATCRELMGDLSSAADTYTFLALQSSNKADFDMGMLRSARLREKIGMTEAARSNYESVVASSSHPGNLSAALAGLGRSHFNSGNYSNALVDCESSLLNDACNTESTLLKAMTLYALSHDREAEQVVKAFLSAHTNSGDVAELELWMAKLDFNNGKTDCAAAEFAAFADKFKLHKDAQNALLWSAYAYFKSGKFVQCSDMVGTLAIRTPQSATMPEARILQAKALCNLARYDEALLVVNDVQTRFPASDYAIEAMLLRGDILYTLSGTDPARIDTSIGIYEKLLARSDIPMEYVTICSNRLSRAVSRKMRMHGQAQ